MFFITLAKLKANIDEAFSKTEQFMRDPPVGVKIHNIFYTLGQYDIAIVALAFTKRQLRGKL